MSSQITYDSNVSTNLREINVATEGGKTYKMQVKKTASIINSKTEVEYLLSIQLAGEIEAVELQLPSGAMTSLVAILEDSLEF